MEIPEIPESALLTRKPEYLAKYAEIQPRTLHYMVNSYCLMIVLATTYSSLVHVVVVITAMISACSVRERGSSMMYDGWAAPEEQAVAPVFLGQIRGIRRRRRR